MSLHTLAEIRLAIQAYNNFLGDKNLILVNPESPVIPNTTELEAEFMNKLTFEMLNAKPCTEHDLRLVYNSNNFRIRAYRCINPGCNHIECK